ncbi:MAG: EAL domain-containing protein [Methylotetracoccus sp.]
MRGIDVLPPVYVGRHRTLLWGAVAVCLATALSQFGTFRRWDHALYDVGLKFRLRPPGEQVAIVAIDPASLEAIGRWPWSRRIHAQLLDRLTALGVKAVGMDLVFAEPTNNDPDADQILAQAVHRNGKVTLPVFPERPAGRDESMRLTFPLHALRFGAAALGHVDVELDDDSIVRSVFLRAGMGASMWPTLPLAMLRVGEPGYPLRLNGERRPRGLPAADISRQSWRRDDRLLVPFAGPPGHFARYSYVDVLRRPEVAERLRGKFVLVGTTAAGLHQGFATPVSGRAEPMSPVEFHANVLDMLLQGNPVRPLGTVSSLLLTAILVLIPIVAYSLVGAFESLAITGLFALLAVAISFFLMKGVGLWYPPVTVLFMLAASYPIWSWRRLESFARSLHDEKERANAMLHSIGDAVIATDARGGIEYMNPVAEGITGFSLSEARGVPVERVLRLRGDSIGSDDPGIALTECLRSGRPVRLSHPLFLSDRLDREYAVRLSANPLRGRAGGISGMVLALGDISETVKISRRMAFLATHDPLTELPNRTLLQDRMSQAIAQARRADTCFAVLFVDLDGFKKINDGMGHSVGDQLLKDVAARLRGVIRAHDTAARWGGDEFVVLLEQLTQEDVATEVAVRMLQSLTEPFHYDGQVLFVTPSIGISLYPKDGLAADTLLSRADAAMYRVKESGCNNFGYYSRDMNAWARERLELEREMHFALSDGGFEVFYQPQIELKTNRTIGVEALLRWNHPTQGFILPGKFIPLAEEIGLIDAIGAFVIETVCKQLAVWRQDDLPLIYVAVNLSPRQFLQDGLFDTIRDALTSCGVDPKALKLEITESLVMKNVDQVATTLNALRVLGVSVAIDDFGTGYSSLSFLRQFPIDQLKIDKSFVRDVTSNPDDAAIAQTVIALAHTMRMQVVAEGVETQDQLRFFEQMECDIVQGFYFSRPLNAEGLTRLLSTTEGILNPPDVIDVGRSAAPGAPPITASPGSRFTRRTPKH